MTATEVPEGQLQAAGGSGNQRFRGFLCLQLGGERLRKVLDRDAEAICSQRPAAARTRGDTQKALGEAATAPRSSQPYDASVSPLEAASPGAVSRIRPRWQALGKAQASRGCLGTGLPLCGGAGGGSDPPPPSEEQGRLCVPLAPAGPQPRHAFLPRAGLSGLRGAVLAAVGACCVFVWFHLFVSSSLSLISSLRVPLGAINLGHDTAEQIGGPGLISTRPNVAGGMLLQLPACYSG